MIDWITIEGFKSIASVQKLPLRPINILIGANGSGKSNFLNLFSFLRASCRGEYVGYSIINGGAKSLLFKGRRNAEGLFIAASTNAKNFEFRFLAHQASNMIYPSNFAVTDNKTKNTFHINIGPVSPDFDEQNNKFIENIGVIAGQLDGIFHPLQDVIKYHFSAYVADSQTPISYDVHDNRFLRTDGSNLAPYLYFLQQKQPNQFQRIEQTIQRVAPFFDGFALEPLRLNPDKILLEWNHKESSSRFDSGSFSDGTIRFIAYTTLLMQPVELRPKIILLDEPELGLHPAAIAILAGMISSASVTSQIIVSTQSPLLISHFEPEDILVAERKDGATQFQRLNYDQLASWLEEFNLGQLWDMNILGGRPRPE